MGRCSVALFLLLLLVVAAPGLLMGSASAASPPPDPCTTLSSKLSMYWDTYSYEFQWDYWSVFARPSEVRACTSAIPFNAIRDLGTLNSIILFFKNHYPLLHVAKNSPDPRLPSNYDVIAALKALGSTLWKSMEAFYDAVYYAVNGLDDGHTAFVNQCPYFTFFLPLPLSYVVDNNGPNLVISPLSLFDAEITTAALQAPFQFNATKYTGYTVKLINGAPAWGYMLSWSKAFAGVFHDPSQKLNWALSTVTLYNGTNYPQYGAFGQRRVNPQSDYLNLTLSSPGGSLQNVAVPWLARTDAYFQYYATSTKEYYLQFCDNFRPKGISNPVITKKALTQPSGPGRQAIGIEKHPAKKGFKEQADPRLQNLKVAAFPSNVPDGLKRNKTAAVAHASPAADSAQISGDNDYIPVYKLSDQKTCVISIFTFYPYWPEFFFFEVAKAFETANSSCSQILIDLSNNGGGYIVLPYWILELIVGTDNFPNPRYREEDPYQMLADTDFVMGMRDNDLGDYNWAWGYADTTGVYFNDSTKGNFFYPTMSLKYGKNGEAGKYSNLYTFSYPTAGEYFNSTYPPAFGTKPLALFSQGFCFSACDTFTYITKTVAKVPLVTIGGIPGKNMAFSAAGGGYVTSDISSEILWSMNFFVSQLSNTPGGFGVQAYLPMRFANGIARVPGNSYNSFNFSSPIEFMFRGSDISIKYTNKNVGDVIAQYEDAAKAAFK